MREKIARAGLRLPRHPRPVAPVTGQPTRPVEGHKVVWRFARHLTRARRAAGFTQAELARRAHLARPYINQLEAAIREPSLVTLVKLARALKTTVGALVD
jgi:DNA-binding XRE family transcriptional regulator